MARQQLAQSLSISAASVLVLNSVLFLAALLVVIGTPHRSAPKPARGCRGELDEGIRYLREDRLIAVIIVLLLVTNMLDTALLAVFLPVYTASILHDPVALGAIVGVMGATALLGNLLFGWLGHRAGARRLVFTVAFAVGGVSPQIVLALEAELPVILLVVGVSGTATGAVNPILAVVTYERIPERMRGRVLSLTTLVSQGGTPLGVLVGGLLVDGIGLVPTLWLTAGCYATAVVVPVLPVLREMNDPALATGEVAAGHP
ncbi:MFS family permease [Saccharopolyspora lacisalsi]|uniref:MFS family permease n=1 Tax=Halosaccharopolyspora lacisalsi TaxID=1000566 RepID=A0A839DRX6_9PSEU|nr:MFS transporter [Halosaccharopolyspora lacisalsi]MBA8823710.1 MFS family permease [Halosaccharopolyspora lacisalsi]